MSEDLYYARQTILKEIGLQGQKKLKQQKVLIVGAGGLGHPSAIYLAAAGIGEIGIIDFDQVEYSNLNRQINFTIHDLREDKATILAQRIKNQNPYIHTYPIIKKLLPENIRDIIYPFDMILDCSDNFSTKFLLHDFSWLLDKRLIQASLYQYEGQIQSFDYLKKKNLGCLRCLWPQIPDKTCVQNCQEAGVIGAVAGILGTFQAFEAIKMILNLGRPQINQTIMIDLLNLRIQKIHWKKNDQCCLCSRKVFIENLYKNHTPRPQDFELQGLKHPGLILVDIRENHEKTSDPLLRNDRISSYPMSEYNHWKDRIDADHSYLFICQKGIRSGNLVKKLRKQNQGNYFSLFGGLDGISSREF